MALVKGGTSADLTPAPAVAAAAPPTATAPVSDGLDSAYQPTLEALNTTQEVAVVTSEAAMPTQETGLYVAPRDDEPSSGDGFDSLDEEVNFTSFPLAKIKAGQIQLNGVKKESLTIHCVQITYQWIVKSSKAQDAKYYFSPDEGKHDMKGRSGAEIQAEWVAGGAIKKDINIKKYGVLHAVDKESKAMIAVSIPPSSLGRLAGYNSELRPLGRPKITEVWTKCVLGDVAEATVDGGKVNWTPWNFQYVGPVARADGLVA